MFLWFNHRNAGGFWRSWFLLDLPVQAVVVIVVIVALIVFAFVSRLG